MIIESGDYKEDLSKEVRRIQRLLNRVDLEDLESYYFKLEKFLFVTSFLIRKLIESKKLSDELENDSFFFEKAPVRDIDGVRDFLSKSITHYNLSNRGPAYLNLSDLTNLFIHSYVFTLSINEGKFELLVTSDWRKENLYFLRLDAFFAICNKVSRDEIRYIHVQRRGSDSFRSIIQKSFFRNKP